jgi:SAM-dependent methyltransferase
MDEKLEKMDEFFNARIDDYENQMLNNVNGCKNGYKKLAELVTALSPREILDLGCGTGLELDEIFARLPNVKITGIDMTQPMLDVLARKHSGKDLTLICKSFFDVDLGKSKFDAVISSQCMHHFSHEKKIALYKKICSSLRSDGEYIELDYAADDQTQEDFFYAENERIRREQGIKMDEFYHFDTPCTVENQIKMFKAAGFSKASQEFKEENTVIIAAKKLK